MAQPFNRVNATTGDYRGAKAVLGERVIEGLENYGNLTSDLQLVYNSPKNILIKQVNGNRVILPNAKELLTGWTVFIINEDLTSNLSVLQFSSEGKYATFNEIESNKMIQCMLVENEDEQGVWRLLTTGEFGTTELEKRYITNVYEKSTITYNELSVGNSYIKELVEIEPTTPIKSVFVKTSVKFDGVETFLNIGTEEEPSKFIKDLNLSTNVSEENYKKDLFEEILSNEENKKVIATFYTKTETGSSWLSANYKNYNYINSFFHNNIYYFISDEQNVITTSNLEDFEEINNLSFEFDPKAIILEDNNFYIACSQNGFFTIAKTKNFKEFTFYKTQKNIETLPLFITKCGENYIVVLEKNIFSTQFLENIDSWNYTTREDLENVNKVASSKNLCVISCNERYFTTEDGVSLQRESNDGSLYDYLDNKWVNYYLLDETTTIRYSEDFNEWKEKNIQTSNLLDIKFLNNTWFAFTNSSQYIDKSLTISRDFFDNITRVDVKFGENDIQSICGLPIKTVVVGENGNISYSTGQDFFSLIDGEVDIVIEKVKEINPQTINNVVNNTQIPIGSIFNYPFKDVPSGYVRLDGAIFPNARETIPNFVSKLEETYNDGFKNILLTNEQYEMLTEEEKANCGAFSWSKNGLDLRFPRINCFIRGIGDFENLQTLKDLVGVYQTDTMRPITGKFTSFDRGNRGEYDGSFSVEERWSSDVAGGGSDQWGTHIKMDTSNLDEHFSGPETQPKHVMYPYIISVYSSVQQTAELNLQSIHDLLNENKKILTQAYEHLTRIQGEKSNINRQCVTIAPNTNYIRSQSGLSIVCDKDVYGTNAQGFVNGVPFDVQIQTKNSLYLTLPANKKGSIYLERDIENDVVILGQTSKWVISSTKPTLNIGEIWFDTINEKLFINKNGSYAPFYAVKIAEFETSTTSVTKLKIEPFRRKTTYDCSIDTTKGTTRSKETEYIADEAGLLYINIWEYNSNDYFYLNNMTTYFARFHANYSKHNNGSTSEIMIPIRIGDKYKLSGNGEIWKYIFYPYVGETL